MKKQVHIEKLPSGARSVRHWGPCSCLDHEKKYDNKKPFFYREWRADHLQAKLRANVLEARLLATQQGQQDPTLRPIDIYDKYIESLQYTHRATTIKLKNDHAKPFFASSQYVTEKRIKEYKTEQLKKVSVSTVSIRLREIRAVCNWAKKEGYINCNLFENIEIPAAEENGRRLEVAEIKKLFSAADVEFRPFLGLLVFTGARYGEIFKAEWRHIDLDKGIWHIPAENCKTNKERYVPLTPLLISILQVTPKNDLRLFKGWARNTGRWYLSKACKKIELTPVPSPHTFRHTYASHFKGDIRDLMDICGWETMMMPKRYTHRDTEDLRKEAEETGISAHLSSL